MTVVEHPAFVCRREGHVPTLVLRTSFPGQISYVCACRRCRRLVEFPLSSPVPKPGQPSEARGH